MPTRRPRACPTRGCRRPSVRKSHSGRGAPRAETGRRAFPAGKAATGSERADRRVCAAGKLRVPRGTQFADPCCRAPLEVFSGPLVGKTRSPPEPGLRPEQPGPKDVSGRRGGRSGPFSSYWTPASGELSAFLSSGWLAASPGRCVRPRRTEKPPRPAGSSRASFSFHTNPFFLGS